MGLDLVVEGCAKAGHEGEWQRLLERSFAGSHLSNAEIARFNEISIPAYERLGAPRVGFDPAADDCIIEAKEARTPDEVANTLKGYHGYYVISLVQSDGVPDYSNGGFYDGVDETSFRGALLKDCGNVIDEKLRDAAWKSMLPKDAATYGRALLAAADTAETAPRHPRLSFLSRLGILKPDEPLPLSDQLDIVRSAGRWFVFWGDRGHPIRADF